MLPGPCGLPGKIGNAVPMRTPFTSTGWPMKGLGKREGVTSSVVGNGKVGITRATVSGFFRWTCAPKPTDVLMARILIVDDEEMDRVLLADVLSEAGHEPLFASDGRSALKLWRESSVDLVVTDMVMPELDGLGLLEAMRAQDPHVKVIAISGITAKNLNKANLLGAHAILTKPVDPSELLEEISRAMVGGPPREYPEF